MIVVTLSNQLALTMELTKELLEKKFDSKKIVAVHKMKIAAFHKMKNLDFDEKNLCMDFYTTFQIKSFDDSSINNNHEEVFTDNGKFSNRSIIFSTNLEDKQKNFIVTKIITTLDQWYHFNQDRNVKLKACPNMEDIIDNYDTVALKMENKIRTILLLDLRSKYDYYHFDLLDSAYNKNKKLVAEKLFRKFYNNNDAFINWIEKQPR